MDYVKCPDAQQHAQTNPCPDGVGEFMRRVDDCMSLCTRAGRLARVGLGLLALLAACSEQSTPADGGLDAPVALPPDLAPPSCRDPATFTMVRQQILPQCDGSSCHRSAPYYAGGLNLSDGSAYASLVGAKATIAPSLQRVQPGAPQQSFLWRKLDNDLPMDLSQGDPMPLGAENFWFPLSAAQRALVYCWIQAGANNN